MERKIKIVVIGAGAAGIGFAKALQQYGEQDYLVIEQDAIGSSFARWHTHTHFISPSFTSNQLEMIDLNAVSPDSSPATCTHCEHPHGYDYCQYLQTLAHDAQLKIQEHTRVVDITKLSDDWYHVQLSTGETVITKYVIFALGDFYHPTTGNIKGNEHGIHYRDFDMMQPHMEAEQVIIGGNEAAFDTAIQLAQRGIKTTIYATQNNFNLTESDPSKRLSTYTYERFMQYEALITIKTGYWLTEIQTSSGEYTLHFKNGLTHLITHCPILATGFNINHNPLVQQWFASTEQNVVLDENDGSTLAPNMFMIGPAVHFQDTILCFIYKFRQRFAPIIELIFKREGQVVPPAAHDLYLRNKMFLQV